MKHFTILLVLFATFAHGEVLTLKDAIELAQEKSPDIRQLVEQHESAEGKAGQAIAPAEPTFQLQYNDMPRFLQPSTSASTVYQIQQTIGFPGRAWVNRAGLKAQSKAIEHQLHSMRLNVANQVKGAYAQLQLARKTQELIRQQKEAYEQILAIAKRRYEAGSITQVDLMVAQTALYTSDNDLSDQKAAERTAQNQLNLLVGSPSGTETQIEPLKFKLYPPFEREKALQKMIDARPEIQAARSQVNASEKAHTLAWMSLLPDLQLIGGTTWYNVAGASPLSNTTGETHTYMAGVQITVPIWGLFNEREAIVSASHDRAAAEANLSSVFNQSKIAFDSALESIHSLEQKLGNYKDHLLPLSEQTLKLAMTNYSSGKVDFQTLSDAASASRSMHKDFYTMLVNYLTTYYSVGQLIGEDLL